MAWGSTRSESPPFKIFKEVKSMKGLKDKIKKREAKVCIVGLGHIGLPAAVLFAEAGFDVYGVDINKKVVELVNSAEPPINEPGVREKLKKVVKEGKLKAATDVDYADFFIIAVPTPVKEDKSPDLSYVFSAVKNVAKKIKKKNIVIIESTVPPGTTEMAGRKIGEITDLIPDKEFGICFSPERAIPTRTLYEIVHNKRVIGSKSKEFGEIAVEFYKTVAKDVELFLDPKVVETSKIVENSFRDTNIAFANEIARICEAIGIDALEVIKIANNHPRVNILQPGAGVGGHCLPDDTYFLIEASSIQGYKPELIMKAREINEHMPIFIVEKIKRVYRDVKNLNVALLGVYTLHAQAEKVGGNIDVRMYFEVYERESGGTENLIVTSYLSDLINGRRDVVVSAILDSNYSLASGSRLVFKVYVRFLSSGSSTTVRFYYQGDVRSRVATPTQKEVLDTLYATKVHALQHELGGADELSLDASQIATGVLSVDRIPSLTRSKITDFFNSPFWDNIPDKPSVFPSAASVFSVDNHIKPPSGATYDLGDHIKDFRIGWFQAVRVGRTGVTTFPPQQGGYIGWNYPSGTGATVFFNNHGGGNTEYIFYSTTDWSSFKELLRITDSYAQFSVDILPNSDNARNIGSSSKRFANLYAVNVYTGDLCFEEKVCDVCGRSFEEGDEIVLKVKKVDDYTRTVPIHVKCSQAYKELDERLRKLEEVM